ncbi:hypothetical protein IFM89_010493 [Coptis chinensis]|uniref:Uncharacterized protein n=1 Tax=Coptis chinensis TaxID=261450 RepID=A0A835GYH6_9MAGN|nr:hypothetical protein IFM89_010493 [Coptis chinensis]
MPLSLSLTEQKRWLREEKAPTTFSVVLSLSLQNSLKLVSMLWPPSAATAMVAKAPVDSLLEPSAKLVGAISFDLAFFEEKEVHVCTNYSLGVQIEWFKQLLPSFCVAPSCEIIWTSDGRERSRGKELGKGN